MDMMTIKFEGVWYLVPQEPYINGEHERIVYNAAALDRNGIQYKVTWIPVEGHEKMEDESECCDWDNPEMVEAV